MSEIPKGLCQCGCGMKTTVVKETGGGYQKGESKRYVHGHHAGHHEPDPEKAAYKGLQARRRYKKESKIKHKAFVAEWLKTHPCVDCGNNNPVVLEFDHRNPKEKVMTISQIATLAYGIHMLEKEILKCDVRCANCHRIFHANTGWEAMKTS